MTYADLVHAADTRHLEIFGAFHPQPDDGLPETVQTLVLLGPAESGFWPHVRFEPEFLDQAPDPMDRWSRRVIGAWACDLGAKAYFPFSGPPYHPFIGWASRSGRAWASPVGMLVHDRAGLMISYRGAIGLPQMINVPAPPPAPPCDACQQPCLTACPVDALLAIAYDTDACHGHLNAAERSDCLTQGCAARRICPVSQSYGRMPAQSAFHMRSFHP
jgi:epoxyqueuosine reductase